MMAYSNKYVVSIIHNNKVQREFNSNGQRTIHLPFDSEYSIRVQNKNYKKALVDILIDGVSIFSADKKLLLNPHQNVDVERFVANLNNGRKFKFVSLDTAIKEGHQDPTSNDFGNIEVVFTPQYEQTINSILFPNDNFLRSTTSSRTLYSSNNISNTINCSLSGIALDNTIGGTVEGSESSQRFVSSNENIVWDEFNKTSIKMKLIGEAINSYPKTITVDGNNHSYQWINKNPDGTILICYK